MTPIQLKKTIANILDEHKATSISAFDVREITDVSDYLIICSATSSRHIKALSDYVIEQVKKRGVKPIGYEGRKGEHGWALIDLGDIVVHIMTPEIREFYNLEKLWDVAPPAKKVKKISKKANVETPKLGASKTKKNTKTKKAVPKTKKNIKAIKAKTKPTKLGVSTKPKKKVVKGKK